MHFNMRNCILMRHGEKNILTFLMRTTTFFIKMLDMTFKNARKEFETMSKKDQDVSRDYVTHCLLHLIKKEN